MFILNWHSKIKEISITLSIIFLNYAFLQTPVIFEHVHTLNIDKSSVKRSTLN